MADLISSVIWTRGVIVLWPRGIQIVEKDVGNEVTFVLMKRLRILEIKGRIDMG